MCSLLKVVSYKITTIRVENKIGFLNETKWNKFLDSGKKDISNELSIIYKGGQNISDIEYFAIALDNAFLLKKGNDLMIVDSEWRVGEILYIEKKENLEALLLHIFYTLAVRQKMLLIHSSIVDAYGKGLMFLGPSGIGKTTQAELWNKYRDALIINGDIVFVQETGDAFLGWGTPWHGSSPYCENTNVPVEAMIVLKQAPENSIRELTGFEKVTAVSNNVFYPRWLENGMELCLETLDHLLTRIPVYELSCRPDEDAVQLTEATIFGPYEHK